MFVIILLILIIFLLIAIFGFLLSERKKKKSTEEEYKYFRLAIYDALKESGIQSSIEDVKNYANDIRKDYRNLDKLLSVPQTRGYFGEIVLEKILKDNLPPNMFEMRKRTEWGKNPDAVIYSSQGIICIDSKFPLENYKLFMNAQEEDKSTYEKAFIKDLKKHIDKIASDYIREDYGTLPFAFAYIPSESIYYYLIKDQYDLLREFSLKGVILTSPLTLVHNITLIKSDVGLKKLEDDVKNIESAIITLGRKLQKTEKEWNVLYGHIEKTYKKADEFGKAYKNALSEFDKIEKKDI